MVPTALAAGAALQAFIVQVLGFLLLVLVLWKFVRPVLGKILSERARGIEETFQKIERDTADVAARVAELKRKLAEVDQEAGRRLKAALEEAQRTSAQVLAEANAEAQAALEKARREVQIERDKALVELQEQATSLILEASEHLARAAMNDEIQHRLADSYIAKFGSLRRP